MSKSQLTIAFRVSAAERDILKAKAARMGLGLSAWLRAHAYNHSPADAFSKPGPEPTQTDIEEYANATEKVQPI
jgi:hypothetical protein